MTFEVEAKYSLDIFDQNNIPVNWNTIYVGYKLGRLSLEEIKKFALDFSEKNPASINEAITDFIFLKDELEIESLFKKLFSSLSLKKPSQGSPEWNLEWTKWRYSIAQEMNKHIKDSEELLSKVDGLYADFGYPEDMASFITYMPISEENKNLNPIADE